MFNAVIRFVRLSDTRSTLLWTSSFLF